MEYTAVECFRILINKNRFYLLLQKVSFVDITTPALKQIILIVDVKSIKN